MIWMPAHIGEARLAMLDTRGLPVACIQKDDRERIQREGAEGRKTTLLREPWKVMSEEEASRPLWEPSITRFAHREITVLIKEWRRGREHICWHAQFTNDADAALYRQWHPGHEWR